MKNKSAFMLRLVAYCAMGLVMSSIRLEMNQPAAWGFLICMMVNQMASEAIGQDD